MKEKVAKNVEVKEVKTEAVDEVSAMPETPVVQEVEEAAQAQPTMLDLPTAINTVIARTEATSIAVSVINAFLDVIQKRDSALTPEELGKIQAAVNVETDQMAPTEPKVEKLSDTETAE